MNIFSFKNTSLFLLTTIFFFLFHQKTNAQRDTIIINGLVLNLNDSEIDSFIKTHPNNKNYNTLLNKGKIFYSRNKFSNAERILNPLVSETNELQTISDSLKIETHHTLGLIYFAIGQYGESIYHQSEALRISQVNTFKKQEYRAKLNLATSYRNISEIDRAIDYFDDAITNLKIEKDTLNLLWCYYHKGYAYYLENDESNAHLNYDLALEMTEKFPLIKYMIYNVLGDLYLKTKKEDALDYYSKAITHNSYNDTQQLCHSYIGLGELYMETKPYKADSFLRKALNISIKEDYNIHIINSSEKLMLNLINLGKLDSIAFYSQNIADQYKKMYEKKNQESSILKSRQLIERQVEKLSILEKDKEIIELKNKERKIMMSVFIGIICVLSIIAFLYRKSLKLKERTNKELSFLAAKVEESNNLLNKTNIKLKRSNIELENFASMAAHDLKAPLRTINSFINLLSKKIGDTLNDSNLELFEFVINSTQQMSKLVDDLLLFSKLDKNLAPKSDVNLNRLFSNLILRLNTDIKKTGANINIKEANNSNIKAHASLIHLLFQNILSNAIKFHKPNQPPIINISINNIEQQFVEIKIEDNGIGIKKENQVRVFELFAKLNAESQYNGSGIGLAICKKIVDFYDGDIAIQSEYGEGTSFIIKIPSS